MISFKNLIDNNGHASIPEGTTKISRSAFSGCKDLVSVSIPSSVKEIGAYAFKDCVALTEISIPEGVTELSDNIFFGCEQLAKVTLPNTLVTIADKSFYRCVKLKEINIPESVNEIGEEAFAGCSELTSITIPAGVTKISNKTFSEAVGDYSSEVFCGLESIVIPDGVTSIGHHAFYNCNRLESVKLPRTIKEIQFRAFAYCGKLSTIDLPDNLTVIGSRAFEGCIGLQSLVIPEGITSIESLTFGGCYNLHLSLPSTLKSISFDNLFKVKSISISNDNATLQFKDGCLINKESKVLLFMTSTAQRFPEGIKELGVNEIQSFRKRYSMESESAYKNEAKRWSPSCRWCISNLITAPPPALDKESLVIPDGVESIAYLPINNDRSKVRHLVLPTSLKSIIDNFFIHCNLDEVTLTPDLFLTEEFKGWKKLVKVHLAGIDSVDNDLLGKIKAKCTADRSLYVLLNGESVYPSAEKLRKREEELEARETAKLRKEQEIADAARLAKEKKEMSERLEDISIKALCDSVLASSDIEYEYDEASNNLSVYPKLSESSTVKLVRNICIDNAKESAEVLLAMSKKIKAFIENNDKKPLHLSLVRGLDGKSPFFGFRYGEFQCYLTPRDDSDSSPDSFLSASLLSEFNELMDSFKKSYPLKDIRLTRK